MNGKINYRLEEEYLRLLFLEGYGFSQKELAQQLQISDRMIRDIQKSLLDNDLHEIPLEKSESGYTRYGILDKRFKRSDNFLRYFYQNVRSEKNETRIERYYDILAYLDQYGHATYGELDDYMNPVSEKKENMDPSVNTADYLNEMVKEGVISKKDKLYRLDLQFLDSLNESSALRLLAFITMYANQSILSLQGNMLQQMLIYFMQQKGWYSDDMPLIIDHSQFLRILDEYKYDTLQQAIDQRCMVKVFYISSSKGLRSVSEDALKKAKYKELLPLQLVFDHVYGRWYLVGVERLKGNTERFNIYKLDCVMDLELLERQVNEELVSKFRARIHEQFQHNWVVSQSKKLNCVELLFSVKDPQIYERLLREKRWGIVESHIEGYVRYRIDVADVSEMRPWIRSFGPHVQVVSPLSLATELKEELQEMIRMYDHVK